MATANKTVEFVLPTDINTLAAATRRDLAAKTIYLPENSKVFRSVTVVVTFSDDAATAQSPTSVLIGIKLGAVAFNDATVTTTMANSGEAQSFIYTREVTSYFTTNWAGTSMTFQVGLNIGGAITQNHSAKILITYDYDDTTTTHVKTIRVPIESTRGLLTNAFQTVGGATAIPAITGGYLPEASAVVRQVWLELRGNEATAAATDFLAQERVGGGTTVTWWDVEAALISSRWAYGIIDITALDLTAARALECQATVTSRMDNVGGMVCVTYEFNSVTTTTVYNSILIGGLDTWGCIGDVTSGDDEVWEKEFWIEEPDTITLKESAAFLFGMDDTTFAMTVAAGAQTPRTITFTSAGLQCGQFSVVHRIDAGGAAGSAGITLVRGLNTYNIKVRSTTAERGWNFNGFAIINYTSAKAAQGVSAHNHSVHKQISDTSAFVFVKETANVAPAIPETNFWVNSVLFEIAAMTNTLVSTAPSFSIVLNAKRKTGEGVGVGWEPLYAGTARTAIGLTAAENRLVTNYCCPRDAFRRHTLDPDTVRLEIETARAYKLETVPQTWSGIGMWVTYHAINWELTDTVDGSMGGTVAITIIQVPASPALPKLVSMSSRVGSGTWSVIWYDNTVPAIPFFYETGANPKADAAPGGLAGT